MQKKGRKIRKETAVRETNMEENIRKEEGACCHGHKTKERSEKEYKDLVTAEPDRRAGKRNPENGGDGLLLYRYSDAGVGSERGVEQL